MRLADIIAEEEPEATVFCHPDDQWRVRASFALMTPRERARYELRVTSLAPAGQALIAKNAMRALESESQGTVGGGS